MPGPSLSKLLQDEWDRLVQENEGNENVLDALCEVPDSSCTSGYDNDGSTGREIFDNGWDLALEAAGRPVFFVEDTGSLVHWFFIGDEAESVSKLQKAVEDAKDAE